METDPSPTPPAPGLKVSEILMFALWVLLIGLEVSLAIVRGAPNVTEILVVVAGILGISRFIRVLRRRRG